MQNSGIGIKIKFKAEIIEWEHVEKHIMLGIENVTNNVTIEDETSLLCLRNGSGKQTIINEEVQEKQTRKSEKKLKLAIKI